MSRITPLDPDRAPDAVRPMFDAVHAQLGAVPNFVRVLGAAPAALEGFLGPFAISGKGALERATRERIALAVAQGSGCAYCVSAHAALASGLGMSADDIRAARDGTSSGPKGAGAVAFARALVQATGEVSTAAWDAARERLTEEEMVEVIAHVALNLFTNIIGEATRVEVDFPQVALLAAA